MSIEIARKRARKFFEYYELSVPVEIEKLLMKYADVQEEYIPVEGDAICLNRDKPFVIIKKNMSPLRKRFTYAHELAHLQIPSHIGMISCTTDLESKIDITEYINMEQEANAFAAELLMPTAWLCSLIEKHNNNNSVLIDEVCKGAMVSFPAAVYNIIPLLPANYMFLINNKIDRYSHIKCGSNDAKPFLLTYAKNKLDSKWLAINCLDTCFINKDIMSINIYQFKDILDRSTAQKIGRALSNRLECDIICKKLVSNVNINYAHLFRDIKPYLTPGTVLKIECISSRNYEYIIAPQTYVVPFSNSNKDEWYNEHNTYYTYETGKYLKVTVWHIYTDFKFNGNKCDKRDSKTILRNIINYYYDDLQIRASMFGRVNGIIGNLNGTQTYESKEEFYNILKQKFFSRSDLEWITNCNEFDQFLFRKIEEIYQKK